ncbi:hypothetical protein ACE1CI_33515 [Aerosakkonemataceae cyanobacterium BLCC-F50]|uniref:Uncharacterized protein n=1 Tax=Floridaenema flaviceps BLCC-F50 TaxID=3153642 RepID=A0ABV4Y406_9CYAN
MFSTRKCLEQINITVLSLKLNLYLSKNSVIFLVEIAEIGSQISQ